MAIEPIVDYFASIGAEGIGLYVYDRGIRELKKQSFMWTMIKQLKQWFEPVMDIVISVIVFFALRYTVGERIPNIAYRPIRVGGSYGIFDALAVAIKDKPKVVITASNVVEVFNLDPSDTVTLKIDGSPVNVTVNTDANGYASITLPSALSAGVHQIQACTRFKCAFAEQYVGSETTTSTATAQKK